MQWLIPIQILALWPVWQWYIARISDGSDEPWGVLALIAALAFVARRGKKVSAPHGVGLVAGMLCMLCYALLAPKLSPLPEALLAILALSFTLSSLRFGSLLNLPLTGLLVLSLPIIASLQFYGGFPIRVLTSQCASVILSALGYPVQAEGAMLSFAGELVAVDAPCAGIKMLWTGLFTHFLLAAWYEHSWRWTWFGYVLCSALIFIANVLRASILFFTESGLVIVPPWMHQTVGLVILALLLLSIFKLHAVLRFKRADSSPVLPPQNTTSASCPRFLRAVGVSLALCCLVVSLRVSSHAVAAQLPRETESVVWPEEFEGNTLSPLPLSAREQEYLRGFPGALARFTDGQREVLIRHVLRETRQLHPAADCLRGAGYAVKPLPLRRDEQGSLWGCVRATRASESLRVCEQIRAHSGERYADTSTWFWAATLGQTQGPWQAYTVAWVE